MNDEIELFSTAPVSDDRFDHCGWVGSGWSSLRISFLIVPGRCLAWSGFTCNSLNATVLHPALGKRTVQFSRRLTRAFPHSLPLFFWRIGVDNTSIACFYFKRGFIWTVMGSLLCWRHDFHPNALCGKYRGV